MIKFFKTPTDLDFAKESLAAAKVDLLKSLDMFEYYEARVAYVQKKVQRLEEYLNETKKSTDTSVAVRVEPVSKLD